MRQALGTLAMPPRQFWAMTPVELACVLAGGAGGAVPPVRTRLEQLMKSFPDEVTL